jgi:hypothetical protein
VHPSSHTSILHALLLFSVLATFSSCHAATPTKPPAHIIAPRERDPTETPHSVPTPTASPTFGSNPSITPSPTPTLIGASPGPVLFGPIEIHVQPIEVQPPNGELHVTASGVPERITLVSEVKTIPFDVRWPKDPLNISIDLKNGSAASKDSEFQKVIDTLSQRNREYKEQLSDLNKKLADAEQEKRKRRQQIDNLNRVLDERKKVEQKILEEAQQKRKKLEEEHARGMPEPEYHKRLKDIDEETAKKMTHVAEDATEAMLKNARRVILNLLAFGALGGLASLLVEGINNARNKRRADSGSKTGVPPGKLDSSSTAPQDNASRTNKGIRSSVSAKWVDELVKTVGPPVESACLGVVAALIVPIGMLFIPEVTLQTATADPFTFVTLCSICFAVGMIGEPFIEFVLDKLRSLTTKKEIRTEPASSGQALTSISSTASQTTGPMAGPASNQTPLREGLSAMSSGASLIMGWALAILGATAVGLIGGKYLHPIGAFRYVYLLFLPGWFFLALSILYGEKVTRRLTASAFAKDNDERLLQIGEAMNTDYDKQRWYFQLSLLTLGAWLLCLLIWWVLAGDISTDKTTGVALTAFFTSI